jgi:hypothetical protein
LSFKYPVTRCIVAWRHRVGGIHKGGGQLFYTGTTRDAYSSFLRIIATGMDMQAIAGMMIPHIAKRFSAIRAGEQAKDLDKDEINAELARLPHKPDDNLH